MCIVCIVRVSNDDTIYRVPGVTYNRERLPACLGEAFGVFSIHCSSHKNASIVVVACSTRHYLVYFVQANHLQESAANHNTAVITATAQTPALLRTTHTGRTKKSVGNMRGGKTTGGRGRTIFPVVIMLSATSAPTIRGRSCVPPAPGNSPIRTSGNPSDALGVATLKWHASASCRERRG